MRKVFLLAMTAIMLAGPVAFAGGGKGGKQKSCNHCTKQNCTGKKCDDCCKGGKCLKA